MEYVASSNPGWAGLFKTAVAGHISINIYGKLTQYIGNSYVGQTTYIHIIGMNYY